MKIYRKIILKIKFNLWLNVKKGYKKFVKFKGLEEFRALKNDLYLAKINQKMSHSTYLKNDIQKKACIQYVNQKLFDNYFFYVFLYFYNKNKKIIFPIPKEFNSVLKKHNYDVNFILSNFLWYLFVLFIFLIGIKDLIILMTNSIKKKNVKLVKLDYCLYANIGHEKFNLPKSINENSKLYNVVNWCNKNFSNIFSIFLGNKVNTKNDYYFSYKSVENLFSYELNTLKVFFWSLKIFLYSIFCIFTFRWWSLLLLPEVVRTGYIKFSKQKLPNYIIFVWSNNHYRPLWTYELNDKIKVYMISVGTLNGLITPGRNQLTKNDCEGLSIANWPIYYAWSEQHKKYIDDRINYPSKVINLNRQIYFKDTSSKLKIPSKSISVFGYENNKFILGYSTLADYNTVGLIEKFYQDINDVLKENDYYFILKRKKRLGPYGIKKLDSFIENLKKNDNVIIIDEDHAVEKVIDLSSGSISMPFTSPAFISKIKEKPTVFYDPIKWINLKDPSAMNLEIINNREDLNNWVKKND